MTTQEPNGTTALALPLAAPLAAPVPAPLASSAALAFEPDNFEAAYKLAKILAASRLLPRALSTPEAAFTVIMAGRELGLTAMQSLRSLHVYDGKVGMSADLMVALVKRSPKCRRFELVASSDKIATYTTEREGEKPATMSFSLEDATRAGLSSKDVWKKHPAAMLRARASAALCRAVYSDVVLGVYDPDEIAPQNTYTGAAEPGPETTAGDDLESRISAYEARLAACQTIADVDTLSEDAAREGFEGVWRARVAAAFASRRRELAATAASVEAV